MVLTEGQIKAQVRELRKKSHRSEAFALKLEGQWAGTDKLTIDGLEHRVAFCRSDLELRQLLLISTAEKKPLIALCPFDETRLGEDVLARLARRRVHPPHPAEILASLFQASSIDPRILRSTPLTHGLIEHAPSDGYPPVASGVLDLQAAWGEMASRLLGRMDVTTSMAMLLEATLDPGFRARLEKLPPLLRSDFFDWAAQNVDRSAFAIGKLVKAGRTSDLVPIGLFFDLMLNPAAAALTEMRDAGVRLESWLEGSPIEAAAARSWAASSRALLHKLRQRPGSQAGISAALTRLDELLADLKVIENLIRSDFSPQAFELRVRRFARCLSKAGRPGASHRDLDELGAIVESLQNHALAGEHQDRLERCRMATRLAHWLQQAGAMSAGSSLEERVAGYVQVGGFVEWARSHVQEGDSTEPTLNKAFDGLLVQVDEVCGASEAGFATKLAEWTKNGSPKSNVFVPIEDALERVVGPIAAQSRILLLVMDGMSLAVFRELVSDLLRRGNWLECMPSNLKVPSALLATIPSTTEVSRRALFRGALQPNTTPTEQSAFTGNDRLFSLAGGQTRPRLFRKGDLQVPGEAGLAEELRTLMSDKKCQVIAAVVNAIDDHLSGSTQLDPRWDLDAVRPLRELLQLATDTGRMVILTSDHGHVLEHRTVARSGGANAGDRYRSDGNAAADGEIRIGGERVKRAIGQDEITVAWSRNLRYAAKKRGYHGGANPHEIIIPLAILRPLKSKARDGWNDVAPSPVWPAWWNYSQKESVSEPSAAVTGAGKKETAGLELFEFAAAKTSDTAWINELLDGEIYAEQCKLAVRGAPPRADVALFLEVLVARGGSIPREALAERLKLPLVRLGGHVANLARIFNVDGYDVVTVDGASGTVSINVALLQKQFALTV